MSSQYMYAFLDIYSEERSDDTQELISEGLMDEEGSIVSAEGHVRVTEQWESYLDFAITNEFTEEQKETIRKDILNTREYWVNKVS